MRHARTLVLAVGLVAAASSLLAVATEAEACSVTRTYIAPTNYELVDGADAVLLARVTGEREPEGDDPEVGIHGADIEFEVVEVYKGDFAAGDSFSTGGRMAKLGARHDSLPFDQSRSGRGMCNAFDYELDRLYVLIVQAHAGELRVSGPPFTRINEVVASKDAPWARTVARYAEISALDADTAERDALEALLEAARAEPDAHPEGLVADLEHHFATPTYGKSVTELKAFIEDADTRERALMALSGSSEPAAGRVFAQLMTDAKTDPETLAIAAEWYKENATPDDFDVLRDAYERLLDEPQGYRWPVMWALFSAADGNDLDAMRALWGRANEEERGRFCEQYFVRWQDEAVVDMLQGVLDAPAEYENTSCLFALAAAGSEAAVDWAETTYRKGDEDQRWKALYLLARSPLERAETFARQIIADGSDDDRASLIQGYRDAWHPRADAVLEHATEVIDASSEAGKWLATVRTARAERNTE